MRGVGSAEELLSSDMTVAIGTDEEEWDTDHAGAVAGFFSQSQEAGFVTVQAGSPRGYSDGGFGWFQDRALVTLADGESVPVRVTGVVRFEDGRWRLVQVHVSIGLPNAELGLDLTTNPGARHGG
ncbi:MAG: nuclear transport factor 2 family protein, partial [Actinomycetota bacterium]|nr:nuclear transport factor 2 family protein [Actinomycetota bacterium]